MSCLETIQAYGLRSIGIGERLLPREDFTLCQQFTLIGSGLIWNLYFAILALDSVSSSARRWGLPKRRPCPGYANRRSGTSLYFAVRHCSFQFFLAYFIFLEFKQAGILPWLTAAQAGALVVLILNTTAYSAEMFYGALQSVPSGDVEAANAYGMTGWTRFRRVIWPTMLRLAWPAYTNEAIFLFHATTLVFFSSFPAWQQRGDALYYANYFADKTFNPFIPYPILAGYFIVFTLLLVGLFGLMNRWLNRHRPGVVRRIRYRPQLIR